jgi:HEAT repeat protein
MPKFAQLIASLSKNNKWNEKSAKAIRKAGRRAVKALLDGLKNHPDPLVREGCAELLGDTLDTKAVPGLINALKDKSDHVRWDALSALNKILMIDLSWWLNVEVYKDEASLIHNRVSKWWLRNKRNVWW